MKYSTVLFDFDYTLADSSKGIVMCFRHVLNSHQYSDVTDDMIKCTIGKTLEESFSILTGVTDREQLIMYRNEYSQQASKCMTANTFLFPDTQEVLKELKSKGLKLGIISTKYRYRINEFTEVHFPPGFFDIVIGGEDVTHHKPNPEGLNLALEKLNVPACETLYIGDSIIDAETALSAGVDFVGVTNGTTSKEELSKYPHKAVVSSLTELLALNFEA